MFRGLFVGIDRYASDDINWLASARSDAAALHALFVDTLGGDERLLVDDEATALSITSALTELQHADPDDVVVIAFSGHGAPSHHLVAFDTDPADLDGTGISLERLTELFAAIPARRLLFVLDCCFSGGMGAKVLMSDVRARGLESVGTRLDRMSGDGRLILTASGANEPAWESATLGHGLLTYHLIEGLLGPDSVAEGEQLHLLRLLDYVIKAVVAGAESMGTPQHPALRGRIDGDLRWPVFRRGDAYTRAFPGWNVDRATEDLGSLERLGFPSDVIAAWREDIVRLNPLQLAAINDHGVLAGKSLLVSAPTSSGKTMIGELAAIRGALQGGRSVFLLPMRALVNDKYDRFTRLYGPLGFRTIRATGEIADDIPDLMRGRYDICLMTNEKFAALALGSPHLLAQVSVIVVDEAQLIADPQRGVALEFLLTMLKVRGRTASHPQLILLSAVIGGANGLERWLEGSLLVSTDRPVPLDEGVVQASGGYRYVDPAGAERSDPRFITPAWGRGSAQDWIIPLVRRLVAEGEQVIVFRETRGEARGAARYLARELGLPAATDALAALPEGDPSLASNELREALRGGVAFHIRDLDREERRVVEEHFRARGTTLRVIAATTTLAMGINTPATSVVIAGLEHPGDVPAPYTVAEYKNMVGRAGRLGYAPKGRSFVITPNAGLEQYVWERYVRGAPEPITSHFPLEGGDPASLIARVLATTSAGVAGMTAEEITSFISLSFGAFQRARVAGWVLDTGRLIGALEQLRGGGLVATDDAGRYRLTELGRLAGETGTQVTSVLRLASVLRATPATALTEVTLITATQLTAELDETFVPLNRKSTQKEPYTWATELQRQGVAPSILSALHEWPTDQWTATMRAKRAVGCLLWMSDWPLGRIEEVLTQFGGRFDGAAGPLRGVVDRTLDLLPTTIRVAELLHADVDLTGRSQDLFVRLQLGVPGGIVDLAARARSALTRAEYLALAARGITTADHVREASDEILLACLGQSRAKLEVLRRAAAEPARARGTSFVLPIYGTTPPNVPDEPPTSQRGPSSAP